MLPGAEGEAVPGQRIGRAGGELRKLHGRMARLFLCVVCPVNRKRRRHDETCFRLFLLPVGRTYASLTNQIRPHNQHYVVE